MAIIPAIAPASLAANAAQAKDAVAPDHEFAQALSDARVPAHAPVKDDAPKPAAGSKSKPQPALVAVADAPMQPVPASVPVVPPQLPDVEARHALPAPTDAQAIAVPTAAQAPAPLASVPQLPPVAVASLSDDEAETPAPAPTKEPTPASSAMPSKLVAEILTAARTAAPQAAPAQPSQTTVAAAAAANVGMAVKVTQRVVAEAPKPAPTAKAPAKPDAKTAPATQVSNDDEADGTKSIADAKPDDTPAKDTATAAPDNVTQAVKGEPGPGHAASAPVSASAQSVAATPTPAAAGAVAQANAAQQPAKGDTSQDFTASNTQAAAPAADFGALAAKIALKSTSGMRTFDIRMDPPELGRVEVHLSVDHDGQAQATLTAERPHTLDLLQRGSQELERALKDAGLNLSNSSLNFSLKGQDRQGDGGGASVAHTRSLLAAANAERDAAQASVSNLSHAPDGARLDIRV